MSSCLIIHTFDISLRLCCFQRNASALTSYQSPESIRYILYDTTYIFITTVLKDCKIQMVLHKRTKRIALIQIKQCTDIKLRYCACVQFVLQQTVKVYSFFYNLELLGAIKSRLFSVHVFCTQLKLYFIICKYC